MRPSPWLVIPFLASNILFAQAVTKTSTREATSAVAATIDDWHLAAAQSDEARFFGHMTADAVFLGIDEKERWTTETFRQWAHPGFEGHWIWKFKASQRNISFSEDGTVAWFDELVDMSGNGTARGSGVLVKSGAFWMIAQYNLSLPIPRPVFAEVIAVINTQKTPPASAAPDKPKLEKP